MRVNFTKKQFSIANSGNLGQKVKCSNYLSSKAVKEENGCDILIKQNQNVIIH